MCLQMDLEPEGKVYVHISLTGSFIDGKAAPVRWNAAQCFFSYVKNTLFLSHTVLNNSTSHLCQMSSSVSCLKISVLNNYRMWVIYTCAIMEALKKGVHTCFCYTWIGWYVPGMLVCFRQMSDSSEGIRRLDMNIVI